MVSFFLLALYALHLFILLNSISAFLACTNSNVLSLKFQQKQRRVFRFPTRCVHTLTSMDIFITMSFNFLLDNKIISSTL